MAAGLCSARPCAEDALRDPEIPAPTGRWACPTFPSGDQPMQWQTPTAQDFRFGFEITLYVSAR
ncbi:MAG: pyrroloquinoline quinone precursor peptide PqqA [Burkholderiales bacterium]|nr:pyrroloquinoline quinone precursor peptide PqqA [Burkholderiales bacterium]MDE2159998.1 pyrroloquinoline quinone precursor peptide PqqA [Burkholderiales bacterium]MDE2503934.1 pyrroloquinoline quinone precursor peptide PqqA [Burkholderiales bacterium]